MSDKPKIQSKFIVYITLVGGESITLEASRASLDSSGWYKAILTDNPINNGCTEFGAPCTSIRCMYEKPVEYTPSFMEAPDWRQE